MLDTIKRLLYMISDDKTDKNIRQIEILQQMEENNRKEVLVQEEFSRGNQSVDRQAYVAQWWANQNQHQHPNPHNQTENSECQNPEDALNLEHYEELDSVSNCAASICSNDDNDDEAFDIDYVGDSDSENENKNTEQQVEESMLNQSMDSQFNGVTPDSDQSKDNTVKLNSLLQNIKKHIAYYEEWQTDHKKNDRGLGPGFFSWLRHGSIGLNRARELKKLCEENNSSAVLLKLREFFEHHPWHNHSLNSYLADGIKDCNGLSKIDRYDSNNQKDLISFLTSFNQPSTTSNTI